MKGALTSIEDVKKWFMSQGQSKWNLYHGHHTGQARNSTLYARNDDDSLSIEDAWALVENFLIAAQNNGCQFTLRVPDGNNRTGLRALISLNIIPKSAMAGIGGFMSQGGNMITTDAQYKEMLEKERRLWELERQVEELQAANGPNGVGQVLLAKLEEVDLDSLIQAVLPMVKFKPAPAGGQISQVNGIEATEAYAESGEQKLARAVNSLRGALSSDQEFFNLLDNFSKMAGDNPGLIRMYAKEQA